MPGSIGELHFTIIDWPGHGENSKRWTVANIFNKLVHCFVETFEFIGREFFKIGQNDAFFAGRSGNCKPSIGAAYVTY